MADSDTKNYLSVLLKDGAFTIGKALVEGKKVRPYSFIIGDAYDFTPDEDGTTVRGNQVFSGSLSLINSTITAKDTFQFAVTIPENATGFTIGNIILYFQTDDGVILPFIWYVSKVPYDKPLTTVNNRIIITFVQRIVNANDAIEINVQPPAFFSLPGYPTQADIPPSDKELFQQFIVHHPTGSGVPALAARRTLDGLHWGTPLYSRLDEPFFGVLDGGRAGESRLDPYKGRYFWGGKLSFKDEDLIFNYGGSLLTDDPVLFNLGGDYLPGYRGYTNNPYLTGEFIWGGELGFPQEYYLSNFGYVDLNTQPENTFGGIPLPGEH